MGPDDRGHIGPTHRSYGTHLALLLQVQTAESSLLRHLVKQPYVQPSLRRGQAAKAMH